MTRGRVGVVIPTHNRPAVLRDTVRRALEQTGVDVTVVVVDDGSDQPVTLDADPRLRVLRNEEAQGPSAARNRGAAALDTPWVAFCDDDDLWAPDKLEAQLAALASQSDARWSCTGSVAVDGGLRVQGHHPPPPSGDVLAALLRFNVIPGGGSSVLVDRSLLEDAGGFDSAMDRAEDWDCWIRLAQRSPIASVPRPLVAYRVWGASISLDTGGMEAGHRLIHERYAEFGAADSPEQDDAALAHYLAKQQLRAGRRWSAAATFARAAFPNRPRYLVRAVAAAVAPALTDRIGNARAATGVPPAWLQEVARWL